MLVIVVFTETIGRERHEIEIVVLQLNRVKIRISREIERCEPVTLQSEMRQQRITGEVNLRQVVLGTVEIPQVSEIRNIQTLDLILCVI